MQKITSSWKTSLVLAVALLLMIVVGSSWAQSSGTSISEHCPLWGQVTAIRFSSANGHGDVFDNAITDPAVLAAVAAWQWSNDVVVVDFHGNHPGSDYAHYIPQWETGRVFMDEIQLDSTNGTHYFWTRYSASTPGFVYVEAFQDYAKFADLYGNHYNIHPCVTGKIPLRAFEQLQAAAIQTLVHHFAF